VGEDCRSGHAYAGLHGRRVRVALLPLRVPAITEAQGRGDACYYGCLPRGDDDERTMDTAAYESLSLDRFESIWIGIRRGKGSLVNSHSFPLKFNSIIESVSNTKL
jgi:hypothetical protein